MILTGFSDCLIVGFGLLGMRTLMYNPYGVILHVTSVLTFMIIMEAELLIVLVDPKWLPFAIPLVCTFTAS